MIARTATANGTDAAAVARAIVDGLRAPDLRLAFVFADWRLAPGVVARELQAGLAPAPVIGGTTVGVLGPGLAGDGTWAAAGLGLYGDWLRVGLGFATDLPKAALTRSSDAVHAASARLGMTPEQLDPARHVVVTVSDGRCGQEEAFCIGSAATAPQIRFVGGCAATDAATTQPAHVWVHGEAVSGAGVVVLLETDLPYHVLVSSHLEPTEIKTVVTAASGRTIIELDGKPAARRLAALAHEIGAEIDPRPFEIAFARYVDGTPYVRSITHVADDRLHLASAVEVGHVLRIVRPGDLVGQTARDLAAAAGQVGGSLGALLAFSCIGRHYEASARGLAPELATACAAYPGIGAQSYGEQLGMLLVNHTLTGLAIGAPSEAG